MVLYLARDYAAAAESFQAALRLRPGWGTARYNLAMAYWSQGQRALALAQARLAEEGGVPEAKALARTLSEQLSLSLPRLVTVYRRRP